MNKEYYMIYIYFLTGWRFIETECNENDYNKFKELMNRNNINEH